VAQSPSSGKFYRSHSIHQYRSYNKSFELHYLSEQTRPKARFNLYSFLENEIVSIGADVSFSSIGQASPVDSNRKVKIARSMVSLFILDIIRVSYIQSQSQSPTRERSHDGISGEGDAEEEFVMMPKVS